jgi:hypothetical protein
MKPICFGPHDYMGYCVLCADWHKELPLLKLSNWCCCVLVYKVTKAVQGQHGFCRSFIRLLGPSHHLAFTKGVIIK